MTPESIHVDRTDGFFIRAWHGRGAESVAYGLCVLRHAVRHSLAGYGRSTSASRGGDAAKAPARTMRRSYIRVIVVWVLTLAALYAFQEYFS